MDKPLFFKPEDLQDQMRLEADLNETFAELYSAIGETRESARVDSLSGSSRAPSKGKIVLGEIGTAIGKGPDPARVQRISYPMLTFLDWTRILAVSGTMLVRSHRRRSNLFSKRGRRADRRQYQVPEGKTGASPAGS